MAVTAVTPTTVRGASAVTPVTPFGSFEAMLPGGALPACAGSHCENPPANL
jgi:hypothetical protein